MFLDMSPVDLLDLFEVAFGRNLSRCIHFHSCSEERIFVAVRRVDREHVGLALRGRVADDYAVEPMAERIGLVFAK